MVLFICFSFFNVKAQVTDISGPNGSEWFGARITVLTNGNYVVADPYFDDGAVENVGAVYLYNGKTQALISTLKGSTSHDIIGNGGVTALPNGNFVVSSYSWDNGSIPNAGAVTWGNGTTGISGVVSSSNSLVGSSSEDNVGASPIILLPNGNFIVINQYWDNAIAASVGAVTWVNANSGLSGPISSSNSLVGSVDNDMVGSGGILILTNGNYVVRSSDWNNGAATQAGAITWGNGNTGVSGVLSSSNSLVGSSTDDHLGNNNVIPLTNGNYVVCSPSWDNGSVKDAGAATWCNGSTGKTGVVSSSNSLVGSVANDNISGYGATALSNGNYVVLSTFWDNGSITDAGAATWGNGTTGISGVVNSSNSLVGSRNDDNVGNGFLALSNGNYVVQSSNWDNGSVADAGAITWSSGTAGITGTISQSNSLVGSSASDVLGTGGLVELTNGNYVVASPFWDNGSIVDAGAVTWGNGNTGITGAASASNSLVGSSANDIIGGAGVYALKNGNYVISNPYWNNGAVSNAGAATWGNGATGISGTISASNSLVGNLTSDQVSTGGIVPLTNGNYVVCSRDWNSSGGAIRAGAATWGNGSTGIAGIVSSSNSLIGSNSNDAVSVKGVIPLSNGNYVVLSPNWANGSAANAGAATWGNGSSGVSGVLSSSNSLVGSTAGDEIGEGMFIALTNGNYVVNSYQWSNGTVTYAGASTWGNGTTGINGAVSIDNSLIGSTSYDELGRNSNTLELADGNYMVPAPFWANSGMTDAGAVAWGKGSSGVKGYINSCNSVLGTIKSGGTSMTQTYNSSGNYLIVGRPKENKISIYYGDGQALAVHLDSTNTVIAGNTAVPLITNSCRIIASVQSEGTSPLQGAVKAMAWIETMQKDSFVNRHYQITAVSGNNQTTYKVKLYFTQAEFDGYNAKNASKLPINESDNAGKANLRIVKRSGSSLDNTGLPNSYTGSSSVINPNDNEVVYNSHLKRWEITFSATGTAGFFVNAQNTLNSIAQPKQVWSNASLFPNPTDGIVYLNSEYNQVVHMYLTDITGKTIQHRILASSGIYEINLEKQIAGVYIIKLSTGEAFKVLKQ